MQALVYFRYFLYIAWYWNVRLACTVIRAEWYGERKYGLRTTGINHLRSSLSKSERVHASIYQPVSYPIAEYLLNQLPADARHGAFFDAGCGKGRALVMAAHYGYRQVMGIDLAADLLQQARAQWAQVQARYPASTFTVWRQDAATAVLPDDVSTIFLFNPFDESVMNRFAQQVAASLQRSPRTLYLLYANPQYKTCWLQQGFTSVAHYRTQQYLEGEVFVYRPA